MSKPKQVSPLTRLVLGGLIVVGSACGASSSSLKAGCERDYQANKATADRPGFSDDQNEAIYVKNCMQTNTDIGKGDIPKP